VATRTKRIELRADPESEALITAAAAARRVSVSAFVLEAAAAEAGRVLGRADLTLMPADQFDALVTALDGSLHGQGLGTQLLLDAVERIVEAADRAGGRVIVVDAIDAEAHRFYGHHGFRAIEHSNRLVMKLSTARAILR